VRRQRASALAGFAHSFAAQEESDQAMAAYRSATRLFAGSPLPWLGIGMEYLHTNHLPLAEQYIRQAHSLAPHDPLVLHELGVIYFQKGEYENARKAFTKVADDATAVGPSSTAEAREPSLLNLGHTYRKLGRLADAVQCYEAALAVRPHAAATYAALAFAHHLSGDSHGAIVHYHQALSLRPDDTFTQEMLTRALEEALLTEPLELENLPGMPPPRDTAADAEEAADMEMAA
jgi:anaphase-promoting complex subunit 6